MNKLLFFVLINCHKSKLNKFKFKTIINKIQDNDHILINEKNGTFSSTISYSCLLNYIGLSSNEKRVEDNLMFVLINNLYCIYCLEMLMIVYYHMKFFYSIRQSLFLLMLLLKSFLGLFFNFFILL